MTFVRALNFRRAAIAVAALILGTVSQAKADFVLDDFSTPTPAVVTSLNTTTPTAAPVVTDNRTITYTLIPTGASPTLIGTVSNAGRLTVDLGFDAAATVSVAYTFASSLNFIPNVAAGGTAGALLLSGASQTDLGGNPTTYSLTINTTGGDFTASGSLGGSLVTTPIALSGLTGTGDLTQVTGLTLTINAGAAADLVVDELSVTTPDAPTVDVPAPPAALLALVALPVLGLRRKFLKKA